LTRKGRNIVNQITRAVVAASMLAGALTISNTALAGPIGPSVDMGFPGGSGLFPSGSVITTIRYDNGAGTTKRSRVRAGMFGGSAGNGVDFDLSMLYRSEDRVLAYCVDILNNLLTPTTAYRVNAIARTQVERAAGVRRDFGRTLRFLGAVNEVAGLAFGDRNWLNPGNRWMSGAVQVGIWESLYEAEGAELSISSGWFEADSLGAAGNTFLDSAFAAMGDTAALDASQVKWLQLEGGQDLLVGRVPVPGSLALVLGGLWLMRSRRRPRD
jgi:hypothetical protein